MFAFKKKKTHDDYVLLSYFSVQTRQKELDVCKVRSKQSKFRYIQKMNENNTYISIFKVKREKISNTFSNFSY